VVAASVSRQTGKAFEQVGESQVRPSVGYAGECIMDVAFRLFSLAVGDRDSGARRECRDKVPSRRHGDGVIGPETRRDEIAASQCGLGAD